MEQARYWVWASSKSNTASESNYFVPSASSWEEEAFAEDATGPFGAFIWPPRSYSCSFCGREFKSAQALGGHMNVHRKDRARLKQGSDCIINPSQSRIFEYPYQNCTLFYNTDDISTNSKELLASPLLPIKASTSFTDQGNSNSHDHINSMVLSTIQDQRKESFYHSHIPSSSDSASVRTLSSLDYSKIEEDPAKKQNSRPHEGDALKPADLPVSLNLAIGCGKNKISCCKRRRTNGIPLPFFLKESTEDLDLELRLGDPPKVK